MKEKESHIETMYRWHYKVLAPFFFKMSVVLGTMLAIHVVWKKINDEQYCMSDKESYHSEYMSFFNSKIDSIIIGESWRKIFLPPEYSFQKYEVISSCSRTSIYPQGLELNTQLVGDSIYKKSNSDFFYIRHEGVEYQFCMNGKLKSGRELLGGSNKFL